jgi:hypothetical protein
VDSPLVINVADWQTLKQRTSCVASPSHDSLAAPTRVDFVERVDIQQLLLADRMNVHLSTAPAGGSVLQKNEVPVGSTDRSSTDECGEEGKDVIDHEEEATLHEQRVDTVRDEQESIALRRDSFDKKVVQEDEGGHLPLALSKKKHGKHRHHETSRGGDRIASVETENVDGSDAAAVLTEYSLDMSVHKTRERGVESRIGSSSSASYEGLKIVVSLSKSTDEKHQLAVPPEVAEGSLQKVKRSDKVKRKVCKHKRMPHDRHGRSFKEQANGMTESEVEGHSKREPEAVETDVIIQKGASKGSRDRLNKRKDIRLRSFPVDRDLSEVSTSYMSPPDQVLASSNIEDLEELLETVHKYQKRCLHTCGVDPQLAIYISQLLVMSRKSVENLDVSTSDTSAPDVEISMAEETDREEHHEVITDGAKGKGTTQEQTRKNMRSGPNAVEGSTNMKEETKCKTDDVRVPCLQYETVSHTRQAVHMESVSPVKGACSCNELGHHVIEIRNSSTPGMLCTSHQMMSCDLCDKTSRLEGSERKDASTNKQLHDLSQRSDSLCEMDIETPPFPSFISDMSLDEYKVFKFPEIFADYSEKCSERISNLTKKIEQIRGEKRKLIDCSGSSSSNASGSEFDSTKYLSPPESSTVIIHHKWHSNKEVTAQEAAAAGCVAEGADRSETAAQQLQRLVPSHFLSFVFVSPV